MNRSDCNICLSSLSFSGCLARNQGRRNVPRNNNRNEDWKWWQQHEQLAIMKKWQPQNWCKTLPLNSQIAQVLKFRQEGWGWQLGWTSSRIKGFCVCVWAGRETIQKQRFGTAAWGEVGDSGWKYRFAYTWNKRVDYNIYVLIYSLNDKYL